MAARWQHERLAHLERVLGVLEAARAQLAAGWVQGGWWSVPVDGAETLRTGLAAATEPVPEEVSGVCLVGALIRADAQTRPGAADSVAGAAIDGAYEAMWEVRGQATNGPSLATAPQVRLARVQALTRWNDQPGRTQDEVLAVLDRAITATIMRLMSLPRPAEQGEELAVTRTG